jgi:CubicO group peptidase (beta-lactamase class C family)
MIAGHIAEVLGGKPFETLIKEKIWNPLGMNESYFLDDLLASRDKKHLAFPYYLINGAFNFTDDDFMLYRLVHIAVYMYIYCYLPIYDSFYHSISLFPNKDRGF